MVYTYVPYWCMYVLHYPPKTYSIVHRVLSGFINRWTSPLLHDLHVYRTLACTVGATSPKVGICTKLTVNSTTPCAKIEHTCTKRACAHSLLQSSYLHSLPFCPLLQHLLVDRLNTPDPSMGPAHPAISPFDMDPSHAIAFPTHPGPFQFP